MRDEQSVPCSYVTDQKHCRLSKRYRVSGEAALLQHQYVVETKWEIRGREAAWKRTLVVMTMLALDPTSEDYSADAEAELLDAITAYWKENGSRIDAVNVRSTLVA
jgi:hypothetical protein